MKLLFAKYTKRAGVQFDFGGITIDSSLRSVVGPYGADFPLYLW